MPKKISKPPEMYPPMRRDRPCVIFCLLVRDGDLTSEFARTGTLTFADTSVKPTTH
jgi:hypothetical protein